MDRRTHSPGLPETSIDGRFRSTAGGGRKAIRDDEPERVEQRHVKRRLRRIDAQRRRYGRYGRYGRYRRAGRCRRSGQPACRWLGTRAAGGARSGVCGRTAQCGGGPDGTSEPPGPAAGVERRGASGGAPRSPGCETGGTGGPIRPDSRLGAVRVAEPSMALHEHGEVDPTLSRTDSLREYRPTVIASIRTRTYRCAGAGWHRVREDIRGPTEDMPVRFQPMAALFHAG